ncbi:glutathione S-transferase theta-1 [Strongylocentrotus purpuratus]|uniref:glutathione transferase n=1 Tax=Strongylocentrotus purpuratus TaxID=7668 RepID=A0A7M7TGT0_STRPU|nr:glutathione S-transferase theta-1 [Strongylocentrotus purpuratus]|eukprot:XP_790223.2 PREDICTED: glutathione S-transferase theta-1 [Strongylocentrotus purpuratus]
MVIKVYVDLGSQPCRALVVFLKHSSIPHEIVELDLGKGDQKKPEFAAINPLKQFPAIKDGDFCLAETVAIFRYLTTQFPKSFSDHWYPADPHRRAKVDEYLSFHHQGIRAPVDAVFMTEVMLPIITGKPLSPEKMKEEEKVMREALAKFERVFLAGKPYILGDEISFADIMFVSEMIQNTVSGRHVTEGNENLKAYVDRVKDNLNPIFDQVFDVIYKWREDYLSKKK